MRFNRLARKLFVAVVSTALVLALIGWIGDRLGPASRVPLDLRDPVGRSTAAALARLDAATCGTLLATARVRFTPLPPRRDGPDCGYGDAVRLRDGGSRDIDYRPSVAASCRLSAGLYLWERDIVQPAALRRFGRRVSRIDTYGTYSCRRIGGGGDWSEHAHANAIDIAGFRLDDGHRLTVAAAWTGTWRDVAFLRDVRNGACRLFPTVLSPDYNAAHRDHLHLDEADRGIFGWGACR